MKDTTDSPPSGSTHHDQGSPLTRFTSTWLTPDDEPMGEIQDQIDCSEEQWQRCTETGTAVVSPVRTVGPNAKELGRRRVFAQRDLRRGPRARGAGRPRVRSASAKRASGTRSGTDPGESDPHDPEPGRKKICSTPGCGREIGPERAPQARTCTKKCAATARKRRQRARDNQRTGAGSARLIRFREDVHLGHVEDGWDRHRQDPYKLFDTELWRGPGKVSYVVTYEDLKARAEEGCRCGGASGHRPAGHNRADQTDQTCFWCGHWCHGTNPTRPPAPFYALLRNQVAA